MDGERIYGLTEPVFIERREYGVHRWQLTSGEMVTGLSAPDWRVFKKELRQINKEDRIVVSPEMITLTGVTLDQVPDHRELIEGRVGEMVEFSRDFPETTFLLGTADLGGRKPRNSVLYIKNSQRIGEVNKRHGATELEHEVFDLPKNEGSSLIPETNIGVLICADYVHTIMGSKPLQVDGQAETILLPSCWGWGGKIQGIEAMGADKYYYLNLKSISNRFIRAYPKVNEVVVVDRVVEVDEEMKDLVPSAPFNVMVKRKG